MLQKIQLRESVGSFAKQKLKQRSMSYLLKEDFIHLNVTMKINFKIKKTTVGLKSHMTKQTTVLVWIAVKWQK